MIKKVYTTDPKYIKYLDCNPGVFRRVSFQSCNLNITEGSNVLSSVSFCDFKLESLGSSEMGGCGGSLKKSVILPALESYTLTAPEIGQAQGEVQMIVVKVKYLKDHPVEERYLNWEYKGEIYPIKDLMILTGRTKPDVPWYGWDLSYYSNTPTSPEFNPPVYPPVTSPDLLFGGIMFSNPSEEYNTELEIFILN
jgi:hypothetical protein